MNSVYYKQNIFTKGHLSGNQATNQDKIYAIHVTHRELVSRLSYKELPKPKKKDK